MSMHLWDTLRCFSKSSNQYLISISNTNQRKDLSLIPFTQEGSLQSLIVILEVPLRYTRLKYEVSCLLEEESKVYAFSNANY